MPKLCHARAPTDPTAAAQIRKLAQSHHAPYDCKQRAQMIALSWEGLHTGEIACHLRCHPQTVRERFERFRTEGMDGLTNRPGAGRKARLTELERSKLIALVAQTPPGRPVRQADGQLVADHPTQPTQWSLDALVSAAHQQGIAIKRSQVRRILLKEGVHWRQVRSWALSKDPDFVPKGPRRVEAYTQPAPDSTTLCLDELGPVCARSFAPTPGWSVDGHRLKAPLEYGRGLDKPGSMGRCASAMGRPSP